MRPQKLSREQILNLCALQFKTQGYTGTSMDMLAKACGLSKASFYYYYPSKEALLMDVLELTQQYLNQHLFKLSKNPEMSATQHFEQIHERAVQFFSYGVKGCLVGILSIEALYHRTIFWKKFALFFRIGKWRSINYLK